MKYFTLIYFSYARSKEGYSRIEGKIPLWATYQAARDYRDSHGMSKSNNFIQELDVAKLRKDHRVMELKHG